MVKNTFKSTLLIIMSAIFICAPLPALTAEPTNDTEQANIATSDINELDVARMKLESAVSSYKQGDLAATRLNLDAAIEWLNKAAQNGKSEYCREESRKLGDKIDAFKEKLNNASDEHENSLARFWHNSIAIIEREIDQLAHSYSELLVSEQSLKYLLDAKMHLFMASHDLFVSHNDEDSVQELDSVVENLNEAAQVANQPAQNKIADLSKEISTLRAQVIQKQKPWKSNDVVLSLDAATNNLTKARDKAPPHIKSQIDRLNAEIQTLRLDVQQINIKNDYESAMAKLKGIISEL